MLRDVVEHLRCPHCQGDLTLAPRALACARGHSFDVARQGYVSLLPGGARPGTADTREMVAARAAFLAAGHFAAVAAAVAAAAVREGGRPTPAVPGGRRTAVAPGGRPTPAVPGGVVVDLGAGTGYYLAAALDRLPGRQGVALDVSKHAARQAARAHPRIGAAVCDAWGPLPVRTGAAAVVLSVCAPRNGPEMRRVLSADGALVVATPTRAHLAELVVPLGLLTVDERKDERLEQSLGGWFDLERRHDLTERLSLAHADVERLVRMGPSARHATVAATRERVAALPAPVRATASLAVSVYRPRSS